MPAVKQYSRINFENVPSHNTPLNASNLNKMDEGIDKLDDLLVTARNNIESVQSDMSEIESDLSGYIFYPAGELNLVALVADDSFYTNASGKYVDASSATGQAMIDGITYKALASDTDLYGIEGEDTVSGFEPSSTPITVEGQTLSTIDEKLNFLLEGKVDLLEHGKPYAEYTNHISLTEGHDYIIFAFAQEYANTDNFSISGINVAYESPKLHVAFTSNRGAFGKYYIGTTTSSTITINNTGQSTYYPCIFAIDLTQ